jgi:hypothetical protein
VRAALLALAALSLASAGCSHPYEDYQTSYNRTYCQALFRCCTPDQAAMRGPMQPDEASCESALNGAIASSSFQSGIDNGQLKFDSGQSQQCLAAWSAALGTCDAPIDVSSYAGPCAQVVTGTLGDGGNCLGTYECVAGDFCQFLSPTMGACHAAGKQGATCSSGTCAAGLVCRTDNTCGAYLQTGEVCDSGDQCVSSSCVAMMTAGMCTAQTVRQFLCGM